MHVRVGLLRVTVCAVLVVALAAPAAAQTVEDQLASYGAGNATGYLQPLVDAILVEKDGPKAVRLKRDLMPEGWKDDVSQLNSFAWWCFQNNVNLEEAEVLGRRGIELASPGPDRASILDTVAEVCNARGNCDDAVELIEKAIEDHPEKEFYRKQLARFQEIRAASQAN